MSAALDRLAEYARAPLARRCEMIRESLAASAAERAAAYERRHGPGSLERHRAEDAARPAPGRLGVALGYAPGDDRAIRQG